MASHNGSKKSKLVWEILKLIVFFFNPLAILNIAMYHAPKIFNIKLEWYESLSLCISSSLILFTIILTTINFERIDTLENYLEEESNAIFISVGFVSLIFFFIYIQ